MCPIKCVILQVWYKNLFGGAAIAIKKEPFRNGAQNRVIETGLQIPLGCAWANKPEVLYFFEFAICSFLKLQLFLDMKMLKNSFFLYTATFTINRHLACFWGKIDTF